MTQQEFFQKVALLRKDIDRDSALPSEWLDRFFNDLGRVFAQWEDLDEAYKMFEVVVNHNLTLLLGIAY